MTVRPHPISRTGEPRALRRILALGTAAAMAATALVSLAPGSPASAATPDFDTHKVLDLAFEDNLSDATGNHADATMKVGEAAYAEGISGQAFDFTGANRAITLGKAADLQPANLSVSFWYKPGAAMGNGEQIFTWNKTAYNSKGWYLGSANQNTPIELSIGTATGQPLKFAVNADRNAFFPADEWTHVVATFDDTTKQAQFYRNGIRQIASVAQAGPGNSSIDGGAEFENTLGYNGPQYNGAWLNGLMDDYRIYDVAADLEDVVGVYMEHVPGFDRAQVATDSLASLTIQDRAIADFTLPTSTPGGALITWSSSDDGVISVDQAAALARVTRPAEGSPVITLTAEASFAGVDAVQPRTFEVTVPALGSHASSYVSETGLDEVLLTDPYLLNGNAKMRDYLLSLDPERFLVGFRDTAGLERKPGVQPYGGWEKLETTGLRFQGHFFGHYMSSVAQAYTSATDVDTKAALLDKLITSVEGIAEAQSAYAAKDPLNAGYASPFTVDKLPNGKDGLLVPFYNLHKVIQGLVDVAELGAPEISDLAKTTAAKWGTWLDGWCDRFNNPTELHKTEYGGMNEALYNLFVLTGQESHKSAAEHFDEKALVEPLALGQDVLSGKHANTTIPKITGILKRYEVFTDNPELADMLTQAEKDELPRYKLAAENFWQIVIDHHTYANGGNSQSEHFHAAGTLHERATTTGTTGYGENSTSESCNEYNMLKLTKLLFRIDPQSKYADYYEHTYINAVLAAQNPDTGMTMYFQPMTAGYSKVFGDPEDEFWCCQGTATESFTKYMDSIYLHDGRDIYVNMFRSSIYSNAQNNLKLTVEADVPASDVVTMKVEALDGGAVKDDARLKIRVPGWAAEVPTLVVNGSAQDVDGMTGANGYISLPVDAGDEITYTIKAEVTVNDGTENPNWVAFQYGPVLLATEMNRDRVGEFYRAGVIVKMAAADKTVNNTMIVNDVDAWKASIKDNLVRIEDGENYAGEKKIRFALKNVDATHADRVFEPYYSMYEARYAIYMNVIVADSPQAQDQIRAAKESCRTEEFTLDQLVSFDNNNSEADKNHSFNQSETGVYAGQSFRHGFQNPDAWFQYEMRVDPEAPENYLGVRYYGGDNGRTHKVLLNGQELKTEVITNAHGAKDWYIQYDRIPQSIIDGIPAADSYKRNTAGEYVLDGDGEKIPVVTVRFQGTGGWVGGVFGVYTTTATAYDATNSDLTQLEAVGGLVDPELAPGTYSYTVTVPEGSTAASLNLAPYSRCGLIHVDGVLIDDTLDRVIPLNDDDPTTVTITSSAQDHTTTSTYDITIVRGDVPSAREIVGFELSKDHGMWATGTFDPSTVQVTALWSDGGAPTVLTQGTDYTVAPPVVDGLGEKQAPLAFAAELPIADGTAIPAYVPVDVAAELRPVAGRDRFETSRLVLSHLEDGLDVGADVFVVSGRDANAADALVAAPVAAVRGGGVVLTDNESMDQETLGLLVDKKPASVTVVGGTLAVSDAVVAQLEDALGVEVDRVSGQSRYETAAAVAGAFFDAEDVEGVLIASGVSVIDALAGSVVAGQQAWPVLYAAGESRVAPPATWQAITKLAPQRAVIAGGTQVVHPGVEGDLRRDIADVTRKSGTDRYLTAGKLAEMVDQPQVFAERGTVVANGHAPADVLAYAHVAASRGWPIQLVQKDCLPDAAHAALSATDSTGSALRVTVGGAGVIDPMLTATLTRCP